MKSFPIPKKQITILANKLEKPILILGHPAWSDDLVKTCGQLGSSYLEWNEQDPEELALEIGEYKTVIIAFPRGENEIAKKINSAIHRAGSEVLVLRMLRDVFMHFSLQLGGNLKPQSMWRTRPAEAPLFFIFAIPRSGSTFFGDILKETKLLGYPREHLLIHLLPVFFNTDLDFPEWIRSLTQYSHTPNGYSSSKIISHLFLDVLDHYRDDSESIGNLMDFFKCSKIIYLKRMNKLRQAVSLIKARKTSLWHISHGKSIYSEHKREDQETTPEEVNKTMIWFRDQEKQMERFFQSSGIAPLTLFYEDFSDYAKRETIFRQVFDFLGVDYQAKLPETKYTALSDETNETVVSQYYAYLEDYLKENGALPKDLGECVNASVTTEIIRLQKQNAPKQNVGDPKRKKWWRIR